MSPPDFQKRPAKIAVLTLLAGVGPSMLMLSLMRRSAPGRPISGWVLVPVVVSILLLIGAILYWRFRSALRERRRVKQILKSYVGTRPAAPETVSKSREPEAPGASASQGLWIRTTIPLILFAAFVFVLPYAVPSWPRWLSLAISWSGLAVLDLKSNDTWREGVLDAGLSFFMFSSLAVADLFPANDWTALASILGFLAAILLRPRKTDQTAASIAGSVLHAYNQGDYALAVERAARLDPARPLYTHSDLSVQALVRYRRREFEEAEALIRRALSRQMEGRRACRLALILGGIQMEREQFAEAARVLEGAAELDRANASVDQAQALLLLRQGLEPERALKLAEYAHAATSGREQSAVIRGWALAENGRVLEAWDAIDSRMKRLKAATRPEIAETSYYAGRALLACDDHTGAEQCFGRAVEAEPQGLFGLLSQQHLNGPAA